MDRKITELDSIEKLTGKEYFVVASKDDNENYKIRVEDFLSDEIVSGGSGSGGSGSITVDDYLSLTSINPVQNKVITAELNKLDDRIDDLEANSGSGGSGSASTFDLKVASVETTTLAAGNNANVEITDLGTVNNVKSLAFAFSIPKGKDGTISGGGSSDGYESFGTRTVFAFRTFTPSVTGEKPATPTGGSWDPASNTVTYPTGWGPSDDLERPVWMSNATFDYQGIVQDWSTPIQISGNDGADSEGGSGGTGGSDGSDIDYALEFIYKQTLDEEAPEKPDNDTTTPDFVPEEWDDHPNGVGYIENIDGSQTLILCEWVCTREYNKGTGVWLDWEGPVLWSKYGENGKDGDGVEYIYTLTSTYAKKPATPGTTASESSPTQNFQDREFIPERGDNEFPWSDNPSDVTVSYPYEWVSVRKFNWSTQQWGLFGEPTLWAKYGKDGEEAVGHFKSFVFLRSNESAATVIAKKPTGGTYASPLPTGPIDTEAGSDTLGEVIWTDGIPSGTEAIWVSTRIFSAGGENDPVQQKEWTDPVQMTDTADFEVVYSPWTSVQAPPALTSTDKVGVDLTTEWLEEAAKYGWYDDAGDWNVEGNAYNGQKTQYMATNKAKNGVWEGWQVFGILGEKGDAGTSINLLGAYDSLEELQAATAGGFRPDGVTPLEVGDCYTVNGDLYVWDGDEWINAGGIKGELGAAGRGILNITCSYAITSDFTEPNVQDDTLWSTSSPATSNEYPYLWKRTIILYTNVDDNDSNDVRFAEVAGKHGDKGIDGESVEYIFKLTESASAPEVPATSQNSIVNNTAGQWTDDPQGPGLHDDTFYKYEYVSQRTKTYDADKDAMVWGAYSEASLWATYGEDGRSIAGLVSEYGISESGTDPTDIGTTENPWQSSSPAATTTRPYLWKRTKVLFSDDDESDWTKECIGVLGEPGVDGESIEFAFLLTETKSVPTTSDGETSKPSSDGVNTNVPGSWTDDAQMLGNYDSSNNWVADDATNVAKTYKFQWVSQRVKEAGASTWGDWSEPTLWAELYPGKYLHIKYSNDGGVTFTDDSGEDVGKYIGVLVDTKVGDSTTPGDYTWRKFEGNDGFYREYIFKLSATSVEVSVPTTSDQKEQYVPTGWSADPISPTSTYKYCMACHRDYKDGAWGAWKGNSTTEYKYAYIFSMYAEAIQGDPGQPGPIVYPAGQWQDDVTYTADVTTDSEGNETVTATPYVYWNSAYYLLKTKSSDLGTNPASDMINWTEMYTTEAIYTNVLVADRALVGDAVFNANYMFSQHGIDQSGNSLVGTEYKNFNSSDPYNASNDFRPNWCVNFLTGEQWSGAGKIYFGADGSGHLADGAISWDEEGYVTLPMMATLVATYTPVSISSGKLALNYSVHCGSNKTVNLKLKSKYSSAATTVTTLVDEDITLPYGGSYTISNASTSTNKYYMLYIDDVLITATTADIYEEDSYTFNISGTAEDNLTVDITNVLANKYEIKTAGSMIYQGDICTVQFEIYNGDTSSHTMYFTGSGINALYNNDGTQITLGSGNNITFAEDETKKFKVSISGTSTLYMNKVN